MCGISGLANFKELVPLTGYYQAHLRLRHRGRDDEGFFVKRGDKGQFLQGDDTISELGSLPHIQAFSEADVVLGHRRLSIIDLSPGGHQPMRDRTDRYTTVYNGEIFNYIELRKELAGLSHRFETASDSEVLLTAFAQWDLESFKRLNGMWAVAIYDHQEQRLILARDRFGIKPLYYTLSNGTLYFASEVKFLLPFLPDKRVNEARAIEYLVHNLVDHHCETMFEGVYQVMPAHYLTFDRTGLVHRAYWAVPERQAQLTLTEAAEQLHELLTSAVALRLRSDVPIGSLLSGGLDSTTIVCIVRRLLEREGADNSFGFFSAVFQQETFSERRYIEETVAQTGMPIHWIYPDPNRLLETLPSLLYHQEFPFRSLSIYSQWEIMRHVHQTAIVVLLNGQGSDEIFAGYSAHYFALVAEYIRRLRPSKAWRELRALVQVREVTLSRGLIAAANELVKASALRTFKHRKIPYLNRAYRPTDTRKRHRDIFRDALVRNLTFSALPEYLRYEDRNSMAFTLESRLPFLDYRLVEWAMSLPAELKIDGVVSKRVLREMARPLIPASVVARTDKMGFVSPQEQWQRGMLKPALDTIYAQDLQAMFPFLNAEYVRTMYSQYQAGRVDDWAWIWRMACLSLWYAYWWDSPAAESVLEFDRPGKVPTGIVEPFLRKGR